MPAVAFALLLPLLVSCSKTNDNLVLVPVDGVVLHRDGEPLAGATVSFFGPTVRETIPLAPPASSPLAPEIRGAGRGIIYDNPPVATTDAQGRFRIVIAEGRYEVWIGGDAGSGVMSQHAQDVTVRTPRVTLDLRYQGYRVSGRVVGPGGAAVVYGRVFVGNSGNGTISQILNGGFSFLLPSDTYQFIAKPDPANSGVPMVTYPGIAVHADTVIDLSVDGHAVSGVVTGPGGIPLVLAGVFAQNLTVSAYSATGSQGEYRVYLPTGDYAFIVIPDPHLDTLSTRDFGVITIDAPRTLDFDLPGPAP
jgi:hypothetical protein